MSDATLRLDRLTAIAAGLRARDGGLALLALGSGAEPARLDRWSDLDFFALVAPGHKHAVLDDLGWIAAARPLSWVHRNTPDGFKLLFDDGLFGEMAVFELAELTGIPFAPGRVVWAAEGVDLGLLRPRRGPEGGWSDPAWLVGEILSNVLVGLGRFQRGERLAGARMVQVHAVDRLLQLLDQGRDDPQRDLFARERRLERRFPELAPRLGGLMPGLAHTQDAARAILALLAEAHPVDPAMCAAIEALME